VKHGVDKIDRKVNEFEYGVKGALKSLAGRLDGVEERLDSVEENLVELRSQVKNVETSLQNHAKSVENILRNTAAIQLNSFRKWLHDPIQPILTLGPRGEFYSVRQNCHVI
jgi:archaellum component FlaC